MDAFENLAAQLLQESGYWILQSVKVNLDKKEKNEINKPTTPRPEIDIIAYDRKNEILYLIEAKSYIDSQGVKFLDIDKEYEIQEGAYKLLTCEKYRNVVTKRLKKDLILRGYITEDTSICYGLIAGNIYQNKYKEILKLYKTKGWLFWGPEDIKKRLSDLSKKGYEDNAVTMTAKILLK